MKTILTKLACVLALLGGSAFGQVLLSNTTLTAALDNPLLPNNPSNVIARVATTTGMTAGGTLLYTEDGNGGPGEAMFVNQIINTTTISVTRGYNSTLATPHISGTLVLFGAPNLFYTIEANGACSSTAILVTPYVNIRSGNQWLCSSISGQWVPGFFNSQNPAGVTVAVASVAGATLPSGPLFHVTGALAITAWGSTTAIGALGAGGSATSVTGAPFCIIPDAAYTTTATNNIAVASTGVINKVQCWTFDQTNKKYVPSY